MVGAKTQREFQAQAISMKFKIAACFATISRGAREWRDLEDSGLHHSGLELGRYVTETERMKFEPKNPPRQFEVGYDVKGPAMRKGIRDQADILIVTAAHAPLNRYGRWLGS